MSKTPKFSPLSEEFEDARLGDPRRVKRLKRIADSAAMAPGASLPGQAADDSQLEGTYRFLNNDHVEAEEVFGAHARCAVRRATAAKTVLVVHDTTEFYFGGEKARDGLSELANKGSQGFLAHFSLCVGLDGEPLGAVGLYAWTRPGPKIGLRTTPGAKADPDRESMRWGESVRTTAELLHGVAGAIHVMDREGDSLELLSDLFEHDSRFVVRMSGHRTLATKPREQPRLRLDDAMAEAPLLLEREVELTRRIGGKYARKLARFPARDPRVAFLEIRAREVTIPESWDKSRLQPSALKLNVVDVQEVNQPEGEDPVHWILGTTEPIDTAEQVAAVVDIYRCRWIIEEYFKALKSGCNFEKLQLESGAALVIALAIYSAVAWRLLRLRWLDRNQPESPGEELLTPVQIAVLRALLKKKKKTEVLSAEPTAHEVVMAIASLGGHLKRNGPPGWIVLGRGLDKLLLLEQGWAAAMESL